MIRSNRGTELIQRALEATDQGHTEDAISLYHEVLQAEPGNHAARSNLAALLLETDRLDEALAVLDATSTAPVPRELRNNLAYALFRAGELDRARLLLEELLIEDAEDTVARNHLGLVYQAQGDHEGAIDQFLRLTREHPTMMPAWNNLGRIYWNRRELDRARAVFESALKSDPYDVDAHNNLGCVLRELGRTEEAIDELEIALKLEPKNVSIHFNLSVSHSLADRPDRALHHLEKCERLGAAGLPGLDDLRLNLEEALNRAAAASPPESESPPT